MPMYNPTDIPLCPHCGKALEETAENYTLPGPGRIGEFWKHHDQCGECLEPIVAWHNAAGTVTIEKGPAGTNDYD
jgi:hypothetical protein